MDLTQQDGADAVDTASIVSVHQHDSSSSVNSSGSSVMSQEVTNTEHAHPDPNTTAQQDTAAAQAAKAIEAAGDGRSLYALSTRSFSQIGSSRAPSIITTNSWTENLEHRRLMRNYSNTALPNYAEVMASQPPRHMRLDGENTDSLYEAPANDSYSFSLREKHWFRRYMKRHWVGMCLLNLIILTILTLTFKDRMARAELRFVTLKENAIDPTDSPHHRENWMHPENFHFNTSECAFTNIPEYRFFGYRKPVNFSFIESMEPAADVDFDGLTISGIVEFRPASYHQFDPIEVVASVATTANWPAGTPNFELIRNAAFRVELPRPLSQESYAQPVHDGLKRKRGQGRQARSRKHACLSVWVGVYLSIPLENLEIHTENLNLDIGLPKPYQRRSRYHLNVFENTHIFSRSGNISIRQLNSRRANVTSQHGSITGDFDLNDELTFETTSGDIRAHIEQRAVFEMNTHSPTTPANLTTRSNSGDQQISVLQGLNGLYWADKLGYPYPYLLNSDFRSESGSIAFAGTDHWEGTATAETLTGMIKLREEGWELLPDPDNGISVGEGLNRTNAKRGTKSSRIFANTVDGDIDLCVDDTAQCISRMIYPQHYN